MHADFAHQGEPPTLSHTRKVVQRGDLSLEGYLIGRGRPGVPEPDPPVKMAADDHVPQATPSHGIVAAGPGKQSPNTCKNAKYPKVLPEFQHGKDQESLDYSGLPLVRPPPGTNQSVLIRGVASFQGWNLNLFYEAYFGTF